MSFMVFCEDCCPAGGVEEFTIGVIGERCDRCGKVVVSGGYAVRPECLWPKPIPVSERLPELGVSVLAYCGGPDWTPAHTSDHGDGPVWHSNQGIKLTRATTHWLPRPPKPAPE